MDVMSVYLLIHFLCLWYYLPLVEDVYTTFERAAHRYADCLDIFNLTKGFKHMLVKREIQRADEGMFFFLSPF